HVPQNAIRPVPYSLTSSLTTDIVIVTTDGSGRFLNATGSLGDAARQRLQTLRREACARRRFDGRRIEVLVLNC
ncbi:MAG: hypothetical protein ACKOYM_11940, partial [Actinomycetes bacterium]